MGVEVEVVGEAVFGCEVDGSHPVTRRRRQGWGTLGLSTLACGVIRAGRPLVGLEEVAGSDVEHANEAVGALEFDHVGGEGLGELGERRLYGVHGFERREYQVEALAAGAILGHAHEAGTVVEVVEAKVTVGDGGRVADVAVVVDVSASAVVHGAPQESCQLPKTVSSFKFPVSSERQTTSWRPPEHSSAINRMVSWEGRSKRLRRGACYESNQHFSCYGKAVGGGEWSVLSEPTIAKRNCGPPVAY